MGIKMNKPKIIAAIIGPIFGIAATLISTSLSSDALYLFRMTYMRLFDNINYSKYVDGEAKLLSADALSEAGRRAEAVAAYKASLDELEAAATAGVPRAMTQLGLLLCFGRKGYVASEPLKAKVWLNRASKAGDDDADGIPIVLCGTDKE